MVSLRTWVPGRRALIAVPLIVMVAQGAFIGAYFARGESAADFARVSPVFLNQSHASTVIRPSFFGLTAKSPEPAGSGLGYDGQFYMYMALDPLHARYYMDDAPYRYSRVLYPAVSLLAAGGDPAAVPFAMLVINWLAAGVGTLLVALLLVRGGQQPWPALLYGLAPPLTLAVHRDLTEPLSFVLAVGGVVMLTRPQPRVVVAGSLFGLAALTRQTTLVFPIAYAIWLFFAERKAPKGHPWRDVSSLLLLSTLPYLFWCGVIWAWLGSPPTGQTPQAIPFVFLFDLSWSWSRQPPELLFVVLPTMIWLGVAIALARQRQFDAALGCAALCAVAFVIFGPNYGGYPDAGRGAALAVAVPMLLAYPIVRAAGRRIRRAYLLGFAAYMVVLPAVVLVDLLNIAGNTP